MGTFVFLVAMMFVAIGIIAVLVVVGASRLHDDKSEHGNANRSANENV